MQSTAQPLRNREFDQCFFPRPRLARLDCVTRRAVAADASRPRGPRACAAQGRVVYAAVLCRAICAYGGKH